MDPLSMTASIIALLQVTGTITGYINALRNASREQQSIAIEAGYLYGILTSLRFRVQAVQSKHDPWFHQLKALSRVGGPLDQMQEVLNLVKVSLQPRTGHKDQIKAAISWQWSKTEVRELLQRMQHLKSLVEFALASDHFTLSQATHSVVQDLTESVSRLNTKAQKLEVYADQGLQDKILRWLCLPDPSLNYQAAREQRHGKTGSWLLSHTDIMDWMDCTSSMIWLHGKAGCGKTVLSSTLIQAMKDKNDSIPVAYFYFDFRDVGKQSPAKAVRSIVFQIALQQDSLSNLERLYMQHGQGSQQPSDENIQHLLQDMVTAIQPAYVILDALDECTDRVSLLNVLRSLYKLPGLRLAVTSRRERDLEESIAPMARHSIDIESSLADEDIATYIREQVNTDVKLAKWSPEIQAEIVSTLSSKADGMFRWVHCQLEAIRKCLKLANLKKTLATLPKTLDETYDRIMQGIDAEEQLQDAILVMQWMCFSRRPLTLLEAADILILQPGSSDAFCIDNRLADPDDLLAICPSLLQWINYEPDDIIFDWDLEHTLRQHEDNRIVRIAHFSIKEYFISERCSFHNRFEADNCHIVIARSCLLYLLHACEDEPMTRRLLRRFPLARYAAKHWWRHITDPDHCPEDILCLADRLLESPNGLLSWARLSHPAVEFPQWQEELSQLDHALYFAVSTGIYELARNVIKRTPWSNEVYGLALLKACQEGYHRIVALLLDSGADINFIHWRDQAETALSCAATCYDDRLMKFLLEAGANVQSVSSSFWPSGLIPESICNLLLDAGLDMKPNLILAQLAPNIVQKILETCTMIEAVGEKAQVALWNATREDNAYMVRSLIDAGVDVNAVKDDENHFQNEKYLTNRFKCRNALDIAIHYRYPQIVEILLEAGASILDEQGHQTTLHRAARIGDIRIINALFNTLNKENHNICVDVDGTSLQIAAIHGHAAVVKELIRHGAKVNACGGVFGTALQAACCHDRCRLIILMEDTPMFEITPGCIEFNYASITWQTPDSKFRLTLSFTEEEETQTGSIVLLPQTQHFDKTIYELLCSGILTEAKSRHLLDNIKCKLSKDLITLLENLPVGWGLQPSQYWRGDYRKQLSQCLEDGGRPEFDFEIDPTEQEHLMQTLLDLGASIQTKPNRQHNRQDPASNNPRYELVEELLNAGSEVNAIGGVYGFALQAAARFSNLEACRLMLAHDADVNLIGGLYGTALQAASASIVECVPIVQDLLNADADVNVVAGEYGCALSAACYRGHINVVRILLNAGANVNLQGGTYGNPLQAACASSRATEELVRMLMDAGADSSAEGGKFGSALGACLSKRFQAAMVVSKEHYAWVLEGEKLGRGVEIADQGQ